MISVINNRLQMADLRLGLNSGNELDWSRKALTFYYGTAAVNAANPFQNRMNNNGNVLRQMLVVYHAALSVEYRLKWLVADLGLWWRPGREVACYQTPRLPAVRIRPTPKGAE